MRIAIYAFSQALIGGIIVCQCCPNCLAKESPENSLVALMTFEQQRGSALTYIQSYMDDNNEKVHYDGTFYTAVRMFHLDGCKASIDVVAQDRFSGTLEHESHLRRHKEPEVIGTQIEATHYKYQFDLTNLSADSIESIRSVPNQLDADTHFRCSEDPSCLLSWISLRSTDAKILETRTVDGIQDFNKNVSWITLPMSSQELASMGARLFHDAIVDCVAYRHHRSDKEQ